MKVLDLASKLRAARLGRDHVGEENVDGAGMMAGEFDSIQSAQARLAGSTVYGIVRHFGGRPQMAR